ncbi:TonB-dependent receptor [Pectinatus haikarae]|uniref:TonB-dependent receptor n=1 Tax=Pectinatus haikarae TaxID=349096 RepID=UPI0018C8392C|nr:TonB-dependent receptor [Pectinatus haikarae]
MNFFRYKILLQLTLISLSIGGTAYADSPDSVSQVELPAQTIIGAKEKKDNAAYHDGNDYKEPAYSRLSIPESSKASTEMITHKQIERMHPHSVLEILQRAMGINYTYQGVKVRETLQDRGGDNLGLIIDGSYIVYSQQARGMLSNLPVSMIDSITIVRDSTILTLGPIEAFKSPTGAPNQGFVVIKTLQSAQKTRQLSLSTGNFSTNGQSIHIGDKTDNGLSYDFAFAHKNFGGKSNWNNGYDYNAVLAKIGKTTKTTSNELSLYYNDGSSESQMGFVRSSTSIIADPNYVAEYDPVKAAILGYNFYKHWSNGSTTGFSLNYNKLDGRFTAKHNGIMNNTTGKIFADEYNQEDESVYEGSLWHTWQTKNSVTKIGMQALKWKSPKGAIYFYGYGPFDEQIYSAYASYQQKAGRKLTWDSAVRIDRHHVTDSTEKYSGAGDNPKRIHDEWLGSAKSIALGAAYQADNTYKLFARTSYTETPPNSYIVGDKVVGGKHKPDFSAEFDDDKRLKYEIGVTANYTLAFNTSLTGFYYDIQNDKSAVKQGIDVNGNSAASAVDSYTTYTQSNVTRKGLELSFHGMLNQYLSYNTAYTYFTAGSDASSALVPHSQYTMSLMYDKDTYSGALSVLHVGTFKNALTDTTNVGNFTTVNASISKRINSNLTVSIFGDNITNQHYATNHRDVDRPDFTGAVKGYWYDVGALYGVQLDYSF